MPNFTHLTANPQFASFAQPALTAEHLLPIDASACVLNCRRAMEFAVKWMYSVDGSLVLPYDDKLNSLMNSKDFRDIVGDDLWRRMDYIRKLGNKAAHDVRQITQERALLCLENLFYFLDFVAYCYGDSYTPVAFDPALVTQAPSHQPEVNEQLQLDFEKLLKENEALKAQLTARREAQLPTYTPKPLDLSEYQTRKTYIDVMLMDAGWVEGQNWLNEVELHGMPNHAEKGYADYVLYDDAHRPLAVIEAKRTCVDVAKGRQQAKLYADLLEKQYGRRPVIFLTNGFDTRVEDGQYPERRVSGVYAKRDLEKWFNLRSMRTSLAHVTVNESIAGRYYQKEAIRKTCEALDERNRRKALLVMATGSGKTRTVIALCDVLLRHGWVKNILFLADRISLVTQAKRSFVNLLPDLSVTNLCEEKDNVTAHCVFSTYQTMMNCIDTVKDDAGRVFTCGHFDLVICDEAHRSIYNKYRDIFAYFDAPLVGLTATPKDDIDKNTYEAFDMEDDGVPTYGYELSQAVRDGYLVDYMSVETKLKFIEQGIVYDELSDEDKAEYEATFTDENGELPQSINSSALNEWLFNEDTIRQVLQILMTHGIKIDYGQKIGKSILFAKNHRHAEKVLEIFNKDYPHLNGYAKVIDNYMTYAQSAIDEFSDPKKLPQIAISVDMLDTGIDVPEVLNLVFFKKVMSKAKFWQMIGRGTRLCPALLDGEDKKIFYIFDFCGNFDFFRMGNEKPASVQVSLQSALFSLKAQIAFKLQGMEYQTEELIRWRQALVQDMIAKVQELDKDNFAVKLHLKHVEKYGDPASYAALTYEDTLLMSQEVAPLLHPYEDEPKALRFDALMHGIELAYLAGAAYGRAHGDLIRKVSAISKLSTIPEVALQSELIQRILQTDYLENAGIREFEHIRECLRDLIKYIPVDHATYSTHFEDALLSIDWRESELENDDLKNYKAKAEHYVRQNRDHLVIAKLRKNVPLTETDVRTLESILWSEVGTKQEYEAEYGQKPLGEFVREIVGLDMNAAKEAFAAYLNDASLDSRQIYFVNQIVEYIVHNGLMKDLSVMQEPPFTDQGSVVEVFDDLSVWMGIRRTIEEINQNAAGA